MAAENIDNTVNGTGLFPAKVPGLSDAADIQAALRLYHYGSYTYDGANTNTTNLVNPSIAKHLQNLVDADAAEVTNRNSAITTHNTATTSVHGIANTADLATKTYVNTAVSSAVGGVVGEFSNLAGTAIDWNSVDERFDVEPRLANSGTVVTKTESFTLSPDDVGKTAILYSSNPMIVTLPENTSVPIPVGYSIDIIQTGIGSVTVSEGSGAVSINSKSNIKSLDGQYSKGTLVKIADNTWFFFGNLLNTVSQTPTPVAPTPVAPTPVAPTPVAPTPVAPTPVAPTPVAPTPVAPTPVAPTPVAPTPVAPQLATPSLSVTSSGPYGFSGQAYANITVGNINYSNSYSSTLGSQNPEYPEEWNLTGLTNGQSYTVYITASRAGYTSAQGSITFTASVGGTPTPVAPTPTGPTTYSIYSYCDPVLTASRGGAYGTQTSSSTVNTGTTTNPSLTSEQIVAQLGYGSGCPTVPVVNPGTVYLSYCYQGAPVTESFPINADNVIATNINTACTAYETLLNNIGATNITCSTSSMPAAKTGCGTTPTPAAPTPTAPTPTAPTTRTMPNIVGMSRVTGGNAIVTAGFYWENDYPTATSNASLDQIIFAQDPPANFVGVPQNAYFDYYQYTAPTPVAPTPVAPTPVAACPPNDGGSYTTTNVFTNTCQDLGLEFVCRSGNFETCRNASPTPVAPTPTPSYPTLLSGLRYCASGDVPNPASPCTQAKVNSGDCVDGGASGSLCPTPTPVAPTPTSGSATCPGQSTNPALYTCAELGLTRLGGSDYYSVPAGWSCCSAATPAPVAPTPVAPTPVAQDCSGNTCLPGSGAACGQYGNGSYCITPGTCANKCNGDAPPVPAPVAPTPVAPDCSGNTCDPDRSGAACGQYGNGSLCWTPNGCANKCLGDYAPAPAPVAPTPVAPTPVAPTPVAPAPTGCTYNGQVTYSQCGYNTCVYDNCGNFLGYTST